MTQTAIDILHTRSKADGDKGFFLLSEAASVDKSFHVLVRTLHPFSLACIHEQGPYEMF